MDSFLDEVGLSSHGLFNCPILKTLFNNIVEDRFKKNC